MLTGIFILFIFLRYKSGLILLLNVSSEGGLTIIHKLQGHSSEIHSLAFCPTPKEHIDFGTYYMHFKKNPASDVTVFVVCFNPFSS